MTSKSPPDVNLVHAYLKAALLAIASASVVKPKMLHKVVRLNSSYYGREMRVWRTLTHAAEHLAEPFGTDDLELVDKAFRQLGLNRPSDQKDECALTLLKAMQRSW